MFKNIIIVGMVVVLCVYVFAGLQILADKDEEIRTWEKAHAEKYVELEEVKKREYNAIYQRLHDVSVIDQEVWNFREKKTSTEIYVSQAIREARDRAAAARDVVEKEKRNLNEKQAKRIEREGFEPLEKKNKR